MSTVTETVKHTKGPWHCSEKRDRDAAFAVNQSGYRVASVHPRDMSGPPMELDPQQAANARLIAAAPELLACLRRMCGMYGAYSKRLAPLLAEDDGTVWTFERANELACEAIAKAEGR